MTSDDSDAAVSQQRERRIAPHPLSRSAICADDNVLLPAFSLLVRRQHKEDASRPLEKGDTRAYGAGIEFGGSKSAHCETLVVKCIRVNGSGQAGAPGLLLFDRKNDKVGNLGSKKRKCTI